MAKLPLHSACPSCKKNQVIIEKNAILCQSCGFKVCYQCPICNTDLPDSAFHGPEDQEQFSCAKCKNTITVNRIKYLLDNRMIVDHEQKCPLCYGPTIHRKEMNLGHRCFFFPKCSGQADLFGEKQETLTFLDFETTGLDIGRDAVIEIGAIKLDAQGDIHTLETFVKPHNAVSRVITNITGITEEMVADAPPLKESMQKLIDFIGDSKIVVHNADFDILWLLTACIRHSIEIQNNEVICTLKWARASQEARCSLSALTKKYNIVHNNAHRALADSSATKELFFIFETTAKGKRPVFTLADYQKSAQKLVDKYTKFVQV